jgi:hypothetical protein
VRPADSASRSLVYGAILAAAVTGLVPPAAAQDTTQAGPPQTGTLPPDSTLRQPLTLPIPRDEVPTGPLAAGARYTFTRDSILWSPALTVADLLAAIPGTWVARGGYIGMPALVDYGGRGGAAVRVYWDGFPLEAVGADSAFVDAAEISLAYLRRVDVFVTPAELRVYLVSERSMEPRARSTIRVQTGYLKTAAYTALFQKRFPSGIGVDLAGDYLGSDGLDLAAPGSHFDVWAKLSWMISDHLSAAYQIRRQRVDRDAVSPEGAGSGIPAAVGARTDYLLSFGTGRGEHGRGLRTEIGLGATTWSPDSGSPIPRQTFRQAFLGLGYRRGTWSASTTVRTADHRTPLAVEAEAGLAPLPGIVLAVDAFWRRHDGDRQSRGVHGTASAYLGPVSLTGDLAAREALQAPALDADTLIRTTDWSLGAGLRLPPLTLVARLVRRDAYQAAPYPEFAHIAQFRPSAAGRFIEVDATVRPASYFTVSATYSDPIDDAAPDFYPAAHLRVAATFRSKFLKTFRSGVFDFLAQVAMEQWDAAPAGLDIGGAGLEIPEARVWDGRIQIQLVGFTVFWEIKNFRYADAFYVPGLRYPQNVQRYGATWRFNN